MHGGSGRRLVAPICEPATRQVGRRWPPASMRRASEVTSQHAPGLRSHCRSASRGAKSHPRRAQAVTAVLGLHRVALPLERTRDRQWDRLRRSDLPMVGDPLCARTSRRKSLAAALVAGRAEPSAVLRAAQLPLLGSVGARPLLRPAAVLVNCLLTLGSFGCKSFGRRGVFGNFDARPARLAAEFAFFICEQVGAMAEFHLRCA